MTEERPTDEAAEPSIEKGRQSLPWLVWPVLFLPVAYVLSIGPAYRFLPGPWLPTVYRPLTQLENHCRPLDRFLTWYMEDVWNCGKW